MSRAAAAVLGLLFAAAALSACGAVVGSGKPGSVTRPLSGPVTALRVDGALRVEVVPGAASQVVIDADENLLELVRADLSADGLLHLHVERDVKTAGVIAAKVTAGALRAVTGNGAVDVEVAALEAPAAEAIATGASTIRIRSGKAGKLRVKASGASRVEVAAECDDATVHAEGASSVGGGKDFRAKRADVVTAGASQVDLDVAETLKASATGASAVTYGGEPEVKGHVGTAAKVAPR